MHLSKQTAKFQDVFSSCNKTVTLAVIQRQPLQIQQKHQPIGWCFLEVTPGFEPGNQGFADPCLTTWLCHRRYIYIICKPSEKVHTFFEEKHPHPSQVWVFLSGAGNEARTRYLHLGKVALYQMSYARKWCPEPESNQRHEDFQSSALPTELSGQVSQEANASWEMATRNGLEPSTSSVTG